MCSAGFIQSLDSIYHTIMCEKLEHIGFSMNAISFIKDFLTNRIQRSSVNGTKSDSLNVKQRVPQATKLGPIIFLLYINDMTKNCNPKTNNSIRRRYRISRQIKTHPPQAKP